MAELVISMAVAVSALVCIAQLMALTANQNRLLEHDAIAVREVGNIMEDLMSRRWNELSPNKPPDVQLSPMCQETLPGVQLKLEISDDDTLAGVRQIAVQIDWVTAGDQRRDPCGLWPGELRIKRRPNREGETSHSQSQRIYLSRNAGGHPGSGCDPGYGDTDSVRPVQNG